MVVNCNDLGSYFNLEIVLVLTLCHLANHVLKHLPRNSILLELRSVRFVLLGQISYFSEFRIYELVVMNFYILLALSNWQY